MNERHRRSNFGEWKTVVGSRRQKSHAQSHVMTPRAVSPPISALASHHRSALRELIPYHQTMPVNILAHAWDQGLSSIPFGWTAVKLAPVFAVLYLLKWFFNGAVNKSERNMHSKVVMVTVS